MISSAHPYFGGAGKGFLGLGKLAHGHGPLVGAALPLGVPHVAPVLAKEGLGLGYGGPLLGGAVKGYDSRFGAY